MGNLKKKLEKKIKINSDYYAKYILSLAFREDMPSFTENNLHFLQDKIPSHTSKSTVTSFENMRNETRNEAISFKCVPLKAFDGLL